MIVIGVDEVGRGALAGDLVVAAFAFDSSIEGDWARLLAKDSKSFSKRATRVNAGKEIAKGGIFHIARRTPADIDRLNIRGAVLDAFKEAAESLALKVNAPVHVIFDGKDKPSELILPSGSRWDFCIKGDASVPEIGAASIIAKNIRDKEMEDLGALYPGYGFEDHAGYGTLAHARAIDQLGVLDIHRSWCKGFLEKARKRF